MYNGIGLQTARGSGTNGYVQRNLSTIRHHKDKTNYKTEEQLKKLEEGLSKGPNVEILQHEKKRKVELKCLEMRDLMEEQGYEENEIEEKVSLYRQMLSEQAESTATDSNVVLDDSGRPIQQETAEYQEALISSVSRRRCLWDKTQNVYKDSRSLKQKNWLEVVAEVNEVTSHTFTVEDLKKKFKNLKDTYMAIKKAYEKKLCSGEGAVCEPSWKWWGPMQFLNKNPHEKPTSLPTHVEDCGSVDKPQQNIVSQLCGSFCEVKPLQPKKRRTDDIFELDAAVTERLNASKNPDEATLFGKSIAAKLRIFTPYQFALARRNIESMLFDIQFGPTQPSDNQSSVLQSQQATFHN